MAYNFTGKVILITGSSSGIGAGTAIKLAQLGADVVITGRNKDKLDKVAIEVAKVSPKKEKGLFKVIADLSKDAECESLIKSAVDHFGKLDILVNNAGFGAKALITDPKVMDVYENVMSVDLRAVFLLTHLALPHLEKSKGIVINMSSNAGLRPFPPLTVYCMAKSAVDMFTRCMALELGPKGIRVNAINPGAVKTDGILAMGVPKEVADKMYDEMAKEYPLRRVGEAEDIANAVAYLASDNASFITGINLVADGGAMWLQGGVPKI